MQHRPQKLFVIIFTALAVLSVLSICPWGKWTNGALKDFNLLGDILPQAAVVNEAMSDNIDPELLEFAQEQELAADSMVTQAMEAVADTVVNVPADDFKAPRKNGSVVIEDYSADGSGIAELKSKLQGAADAKMRIAMVGDSYIEGDIFSQDIRSSLQDLYGGSGVGYVGAFSQFPGFRQSVTQTSDNWDEMEIKNMKNDNLRTILGRYHTAAVANSKVKFRGSSKIAHAGSWDNTMVLFVAPHSGEITFTGTDNTSEACQVEGSQDIQCVALSTTCTNIEISSDILGLKVLGIWLEGNTGVVLDNISLRGNSGISHRRLSESATAAMRRWVDYDLIILEFGLNALSAGQKDYTSYCKAMIEVVNNLKNLYPQVQILIMGVGDRGTKSGAEFISMKTIPAMVRAQREVARRTGSLFYDTREAMGGEGASLDWHKRKLLNSDFVHLNHKGGKELADIFIESLSNSLQ